MLAARRGRPKCLRRNFNLVEGDDFFGTGSVVSRSQGKFLVSYDWRSLPE